MGLLVPRPEPNAGSENHVAFLALERVSKHYGPMAAVDDVALTIQKGEFVSLLGPSGCGKTTTLQMIAGLVEPSAGRITLDGRTSRTKSRANAASASSSRATRCSRT